MENKTIRIAFGSKARVGKDMACDYLITKYGGTKVKNAKCVYLAQNAVCDVLGLDIRKYGDLLQFIGEWGRKQDEDLWINKTLDEIKNYEGNIYILVI